MAYKKQKFGDYRERINFAKSSNTLELADLLEIQKKSYQNFIENGIKEVFEDLFPVESFTGNISLEFTDYSLDEPRYSIKEAKERMVNYAAPLKVQARLYLHETGEVKEQEIFLGDLPLMTDAGTFIINGAERVIVSQLVRSPSIYFKREIDKNGRRIVSGEIIPNKGTWLEYETDAKGVIYVRIDRTRKVAVTTFLRALGLSTDEEIIELFGDNEFVKNTLEKDITNNTDEALLEIYEKLRPGEPATIDSAKNQLITRFFDRFRYDLAKVGRYKFNKKMFICERILGCTLAENIKFNGEEIAKKGDVITKDILEKLKVAFAGGLNLKEATINEELDDFKMIQTLKVYDKIDGKKVLTLIGTDSSVTEKRLTIPDVYASLSYYIDLHYNIGNEDEIDHLGNRRVRQVGELVENQFRVGMARMERVIRERMTTQEIDTVTPKTLINIRPVTAALKEFFGSSQLSKFMDQINPIAELTDKRRLSSLGPGGLSRERAGMEVRDVNVSHYGRICPIESPEGANIGLITSLASYAKLNEYGFITTPYRKVVNKHITDDVVYLTADEEDGYYISQATVAVDKDNNITEGQVIARLNGENVMVEADKVNFVDVSPSQIVSVTTSCIPFLDHDDAKRALMGSNMQRQAVPLMTTEAPIIATGIEYRAAMDSGILVLAEDDGFVEKVTGNAITMKYNNGKTVVHKLRKFKRTNGGTCINQRPIVKKGEIVKKGDALADGPATKDGEMALGKNMLVAFSTWEGYNYEDAILLNERLVQEDVFTSIHIEEYDCECRDTKLGAEEITRDIPNVGDDALKDLDENGIIRIGAEVRPGDILVGKVTPKGETELTAEERLLRAIFGEKSREVRDTSLRVPHGEAGTIVDIKVFTRENSEELAPGVNQVIRCYIATKRKISVGDKMAGRHGNKGVISRILPEEDLPFLPDGTPVDIVLNPMGIPSRMNLGQVLEVHLGMAARALGWKVATPVFDGAKDYEIEDLLEEAGLRRDGKTILYDGRTGEQFIKPITVGVMYMMKLHHLVDDKIHARSTGPYSLVTQQPLGGKAQFGGQRFGEMEVWALEAYGAAYSLQEMLTVKSDDVVGRVKTYEAIVKGENIPEPGVPEGFKVLVKELEALGLDIRLYTHDNKEVELKEDIDDSTSFSNIENKSLHEENVVDENELSDGYTEESSDDEDSEDDKLFDDLDDENDDIILDDDSSILEDEDFNDDDE